ncbi:MAG: hypothetical protein AXA67_02165 [Methylothermaceae bacteria B42]|nr:MAG: hypothetical protein AXA67_02165 [Methylothermaceae bacteria B42]HHJ40067.1 DUF3631 domain-containing protein [Methylothermaceae bacterium]
MIDETGRKSALAGGKRAGCWWAAQAMPESTSHLLIGEGIATVLSAREATGWPGVATLSCANLKSVAEAMRRRYPGANLVILADLGNGQARAGEAARAVDGALAVPDFGGRENEDLTDFNDLAHCQGIDTIKRLIMYAKTATNDPGTSRWEKPVLESVTSLERVIDALAELKPIEYEPYRKSMARRFGLRPSILDAAVRERRRELEEVPAGSGILAPLPKPWPDPVDGAALLDELRAVYTRHLVLPDHAAEALALWTLGTYIYNSFRIWPKLLVTSPEKRCGKSTLRETLEAVARQAMPTSNITPAALFRTIDMAHPTITIDEADAFLADNDDLRGIINSGHTKRGAFVIRCDGDDNQPKRFSTWAPMAIFMIKLPADTIVDRSIVIQLRRKLPSERVERMPLDLDERCLPIRRRCVRWAEDNAEKLKRADPDMPQHGNDRALDNWLPLFAIAEAAGGEWPVNVRLAFNGLETLDEDDGIGPLILRDIRTVFTERRIERMFSRELVAALIEIEESPWAEWRRGKPLTQNSLARLLKPFGIRPHIIRIGPDIAKGYEFDRFRDAFARYIADETVTNHEKNAFSLTTPFQTVTPLQPRKHAGYSDFQTVTQNKDVTVEKPLKAAPQADCNGVTDEKPPSRKKNKKISKNPPKPNGDGRDIGEI